MEIPKYKLDEYRRRNKEELSWSDEKLSIEIKKRKSTTCTIAVVIFIALYAAVIAGTFAISSYGGFRGMSDGVDLMGSNYCAMEGKGQFMSASVKGTLFPYEFHDKVIIYCENGNVILTKDQIQPPIPVYPMMEKAVNER